MMKDKFQVPKIFSLISLILAGIGVLAFIFGIMRDPAVTWGSYLVSAYYFLSLSIGAAFFFAIQNITQSGWSSAFRRIPEAMMSWIPFAFIFFILLYFGMNDLYHWTHEDVITNDELIVHKSVYLNVPFFFIRMILSFGMWIILVWYLRKLSLREERFEPNDTAGILKNFHRIEFYSRIFIFVLALTFTIAAFDWIMSLEPHWFSSIFAFKNFVAAFYHGVTIIALIVFILYRIGYFPFLNKYHLHDFARYIFILSIIWGYMWFAQFLIIWYGNIPEETAYYFDRWQQGWKIFFWLQIALNWGVPFLVLLPVQTSRNLNIIIGVIAVLIIGQYIDLYVQIMPPLAGQHQFSLIDAALFLGFAGLFSFVVSRALTRAELVPKNHPYLVESLEHQFD
ncbi:MAG TPA: hypothetical protein VK213_06850 [Bacteroidales bacterium]|nr:hypothetical protein [Bacteroidales bacterium]